MHVVGSSVDLPPVASDSQIRLDDSESATSPGADSDFYHSVPNTPADTGRAKSEGFDDAATVNTHGIDSYIWNCEGPLVWVGLIFVPL